MDWVWGTDGGRCLGQMQRYSRGSQLNSPVKDIDFADHVHSQLLSRTTCKLDVCVQYEVVVPKPSRIFNQKLQIPQIVSKAQNVTRSWNSSDSADGNR